MRKNKLMLVAAVLLGWAAHAQEPEFGYTTGAPPGEGVAATSGVETTSLCNLYGIPSEDCPREWKCPVLVAGDLVINQKLPDPLAAEGVCSEFTCHCMCLPCSERVEPQPHMPGEDGCAACPPCTACPPCAACPPDTEPTLAERFSCAVGDIDGDGLVGPTDFIECSQLGGRESVACTAFVQAYWGQTCEAAKESNE